MLSATLLSFMSPGDITLILVVALVFFGGKKLPELARGLGQGIKEFKDATEGHKNDPQPPVNQAPPAPPQYNAPQQYSIPPQQYTAPVPPQYNAPAPPYTAPVPPAPEHMPGQQTPPAQ
jgi:sec-independent protein translocase protein TatA